MAGGGGSGLLDYSASPTFIPLDFGLWTLDLRLWTRIWDLDLGLRIGLGLDKNSAIFQSIKILFHCTTYTYV